MMADTLEERELATMDHVVVGPCQNLTEKLSGARIELRPGDVVVLMTSVTIPEGPRERMTAAVQTAFPKNRVLILDKGISIGIVGAPLSQEEADRIRGSFLKMHEGVGPTG